MKPAALRRLASRMHKAVRDGAACYTLGREEAHVVADVLLAVAGLTVTAPPSVAKVLYEALRSPRLGDGSAGRGTMEP